MNFSRISLIYPCLLSYEVEFIFIYLGPSDIHHVHFMHLDLNNLRHFQVVRKQLVKVDQEAIERAMDDASDVSKSNRRSDG
jgi:phosphatidylserine decarboxylase